MSIKTKIWIRVVVIVGLIAWPGYETYKLWWTTQKMTEAQALERKVRAKVEATRAKHVEVANAAGNTTATPPDPSKP
jgi:predicted negative regulator of RcsB-dependent stress response